MSDQSSAYSHSLLFTVRLWKEEMGSAGNEMRGEVRHVLGGGVRYFQDWSTLVTFLAETVHELERQRGGAGGEAK